MARIVDLARLHEELNEEQVAAAAKTEGPALILFLQAPVRERPERLHIKLRT